ncbi:nuclear transport factor 2 family protein [Pseudonocardia sp. NPDC049154]|uniref:nuclear transport factor 2 family protein n=1 Tax=Pseudonocardia sp. NPDC049154 TaxID=3155501 RepID=UPI0033EAEA76
MSEQDIAAGPVRRDPPPRLSELEVLVAHEDIRQLAARYALAVSQGDLDTVVDLFVEDVQVTREVRGRAALREFLGAQVDAMPVSILLVAGHVINLLDADHAAGTVSCLCEMGREDRWVRQAIAYRDRYERRDGRWYFVDRRHDLYYGVDVPERPVGQPDAHWPRSITGRGSVPYRWATWQALRNR